MATRTPKKIRVVAYLDPEQYRYFKTLLPILRPGGLDFSKWVRHKVKEELARAATKRL